MNSDATEWAYGMAGVLDRVSPEGHRLAVYKLAGQWRGVVRLMINITWGFSDNWSSTKEEDCLMVLLDTKDAAMNWCDAISALTGELTQKN